jgi:hypothetical protein
MNHQEFHPALSYCTGKRLVIESALKHAKSLGRFRLKPTGKACNEVLIKA